MYVNEIVIPNDVTAGLSDNIVSVKGLKGEIKKPVKLSKGMKIEFVDNKVRVSSESDRRKSKAIVGTTIAHIRNAIEGVTKGYTYRLKVVYSHFPVTLKVEGDRVLIQNFLGERTSRVAKIVGNVEVKIDGADITVSGIDVDEVSRTAANMEQAARITGKDRRTFQDGVWLVSRE